MKSPLSRRLPRGDEALELLAENVRLAQAALPVPLALENSATLFEWPSPAFTEARLLAGLLARTSALLLDVAKRTGAVSPRLLAARLPGGRVLRLRLPF